LRVRGRGSKLADAKLGASLGSVCLRASSGVGYRVNGRKKDGRGIVVCSAAAAAAAGGADRGYGVARSRGSSDDEESSHQEEISLLPFVNNTRQPSHEPRRTWRDHAMLLGVGMMLGMFAWSGFQPSFSPVANAATAEIFIKPLPKRSSHSKASVEERAIYALDYFFATKPGGKAIILLAICASLTGIGGILYYRAAQAEGDTVPLSESLWSAWTFISDPGTHAGEAGLRRRLVAVPLTMGGMLFFALLVGLMSDGVSARVDYLHKGANPVIEENHTIIIGWTPKTVPLVRQLTEANSTRGLKRSIVILGNRDKAEMDEELRLALPVSDRNGSKIVTRTGIPTESDDLRMCSANMARSIILLSPAGLPPFEADAFVLHRAIVLAYLSELKADIVVELAELENVQVLKEVLSTLMNYSTTKISSTRKGSLTVSSDPQMLHHSRERLQKMVPVATGDFVMRMMVERALQPEIAAVSAELLRFDGSEFRFKRWPELVGKTFGEIVYLFDDAIPCGMRKQRPTNRGKFTLINPPHDTVFEDGDRLLVISEDDESYKPGESNAPEHPAMSTNVQALSKQALKILICGWRHDLKDVLVLIDNNVAKGSEVTILTCIETDLRIKELKNGSPLQNIKVTHKYGDPLSRQVLETLPLEQYHKTIILADQDKDLSSHPTTTTAMFVRHIQIQRGNSDAVIVAELPSTQEDALQKVQMTWLNDSVQPEQLQAMVLAHLAEDSDVGAVLDEVVSDYGSSLSLRKIDVYAKPEETFNFWELQARALQHGEIVIAHKCATDGDQWVLNPPNKGKVLSWSEGDEVLVLTRPR